MTERQLARLIGVVKLIGGISIFFCLLFLFIFQAGFLEAGILRAAITAAA